MGFDPLLNFRLGVIRRIGGNRHNPANRTKRATSRADGWLFSRFPQHPGSRSATPGTVLFATRTCKRRSRQSPCRAGGICRDGGRFAVCTSARYPLRPSSDAWSQIMPCQ